MKNLINKIDLEGNVSDGIFNNINSFCSKKINESKCQKFYKNTFKDLDGMYTCPYGFNCIKKNENIYNCLLIKDNFNLGKIKDKKEKLQKVFTIDEISQIIDINEQNILEENEREFQRKNIDDFLHDVTKANRLIETKISSINNKNLNNKEVSKIQSVDHLSDFITKRIDLYRYANNPELIKFGSFRKRDAYKLWDIYRYIFNEIAEQNNLTIKMIKYDMNGNISNSGCSNFYAKDSVTILPFLLIDNAVKYSKEKSSIDISFYQENDNLKRMTVTSVPAYFVEDNVEQLFERGYRSNFKGSKSTGNGLGLSIVKLICEHNNISVKITIQPQADNNQLFNVEMYFND